MFDRLFRSAVLAGVVGVWVLVFLIAGLARTVSRGIITVEGTVSIDEISSPVEVEGTVSVDHSSPVDINFAQIVGNDLVESQKGMYIGVSSTDNRIIPIHWGEVSIVR